MQNRSSTKFDYFFLPYRRYIIKKFILIGVAFLVLSACSTGQGNKASVIEETTIEPEERHYLAELVEEHTGDPGLVLYNNSETKQIVENFFSNCTDSEEVSAAILQYAAEYEIPFALAFAVPWVESRYYQKAVNYNRYSVDRGLFQLNSLSFPDLKEQDFFNLEINAQHGLEYLKKCIELGENEIVGLAMYNAGMYRVEHYGIPKMTLNYINEILTKKESIEKEFSKVMQNTYVPVKKEKTEGKWVKKVKRLLDTTRGI